MLIYSVDFSSNDSLKSLLFCLINAWQLLHTYEMHSMHGIFMRCDSLIVGPTSRSQIWLNVPMESTLENKGLQDARYPRYLTSISHSGAHIAGQHLYSGKASIESQAGNFAEKMTCMNVITCLFLLFLCGSSTLMTGRSIMTALAMFLTIELLHNTEYCLMRWCKQSWFKKEYLLHWTRVYSRKDDALSVKTLKVLEFRPSKLDLAYAWTD